MSTDSETSLPLGDIVHGDCVSVLATLPCDAVDAVYMDPPFFTQKQQEKRHRKTNATLNFNDLWCSRDEYLGWLEARFLHIHRVLKPSGAFLLHCDWRMSHHIRVLIERIFGEDNFRNEIIWSYKRWTNGQNSLQRLHQTVLYYAKSQEHVTNVPLIQYSETTNLDQIWQKRTRDENGISVYELDDNGIAKPLGKAKLGVPSGDVWEIPYLNPKAKERTGYPTQKPLELLERLLEVVSKEGEIILDPTCGSGTTLVAAERQNRRWIGIDASEDAVALCRERLANPLKSVSVLIEKGRGHFQETTNKANAHLRDVLEALEAHPVYRNKNLDGFLRHSPSELPVGVRLISSTEDFAQSLSQFVATLIKKKCGGGVCIFEDGARQMSFLEASLPTEIPLVVLPITELGNATAAIKRVFAVQAPLRSDGLAKDLTQVNAGVI